MFSLRSASRFARTLCAVILVLSLSAVLPCAAQESGDLAAADSFAPREDAAESEKLTNEDVLKLSTAGLPPNVITAKISASETDFDTSVDTLLALSEAGIHPDVLAAMSEAGKKPAAPAPVAAAPVGGGGPVVVKHSASAAANVRANFEGTRCEAPGIYLEDGEDLTLIEPTAPGQAQSGGFLKLSTRRRVAIRGLKARVRIENAQPKFLFCFEETQAGLSYTTGGAVNPSEYLLVTMRLDEKQRQRYYVSAKVSKITGTERSGAASQYLHDIRFNRVKPGVYEVASDGNLARGEYSFYYPGIAGGEGSKLFPFGVD